MAMGIHVTAANESTGVQNPHLSQIRSSSHLNPTPYVGRVSSHLRDSVWSGLLSLCFSPFLPTFGFSPSVLWLTRTSLITFQFSHSFKPMYIHQSMWWLLSYIASKFVQHMLSAWPQTHVHKAFPACVWLTVCKVACSLHVFPSIPLFSQCSLSHPRYFCLTVLLWSPFNPHTHAYVHPPVNLDHCLAT